MKYLSSEMADRLTEALVDYASKKKLPHYEAGFLILRFSGCRIGEAQLVDRKSVVWDPFPGLWLVTLKRRSRDVHRLVPMPEEVLKRIESILESASMRKFERSNVRKLMHRVGVRLGIERRLLHPHVFRHSRAIELLASGLSVPEVAVILGHARLQTTQTYLQFVPVDIYSRMKEKGIL